VFSRFTRIEMGDGSKINFWGDVWYEKHPLKVAFPKLFSIVYFKDAYAA
jgi:hypothetical protein